MQGRRCPWMASMVPTADRKPVSDLSVRERASRLALQSWLPHGQETRHEDCPPFPPRPLPSRARRVRSRAAVVSASASTRSTTSRGSRTSRRRPFRASSTSRRSCARKRARASPRSSSASASRRIRRRAALAFRRSFLIGLIYDNPNAPYVINFQEGALGALRRVGLRARRASVRSPQRGVPDRHPPLRHAPEARRRDDAAAGLGESDARGDAAQAGMSVHPRDRRGARRSEEPGHVDGSPVRGRSRRAPGEARPHGASR